MSWATDPVRHRRLAAPHTISKPNDPSCPWKTRTPPDGTEKLDMYDGPEYSTTLEGDYEVLSRVRNTWHSGGFEGPHLHFFSAHLSEIWQKRCPVGHIVTMQYQAGDYSHAAYLAIGAKNELKEAVEALQYALSNNKRRSDASE